MSVSLAIIGCGAIAARHAATLAGFGGRARLAFASRTPGRAAAYAARHRGFASFGSYAEALADPRIDAVLVTTPPADHLPVTLQALAAGKHVIVEKPAFPRAADVDGVLAAARAAGRRVLVAENYRYKPATRRLAELVETGAIGTLRLVRLSALKLQQTPPADWRSDPALAMGGALYEGGVHWVNLLTTLGGAVAETRGYRPSAAEPERTMVVVVRFASGAIGTLHHSWETPARFQGLGWSQLAGAEGTIAFESNGLVLALNGRRKRLIFPGFRDLKGFRAMFDDFLRVLERGGEPLMTLVAARHDLEVIEAAYRTATPT